MKAGFRTDVLTDAEIATEAFAARRAREGRPTTAAERSEYENAYLAALAERSDPKEAN